MLTRLLSYPGVEWMFMHRSRAARFTAAYLLFTVTLLMVRKTDSSETLFDETNSPTNENDSRECCDFIGISQGRHNVYAKNICTAAEDQCPQNFASLRGRLTDSRTSRELFCSLLC
jgi:hypothetical protein